MNAQSEQEDKALMAKAASGDTSALDRLYQKHWQTIDAFVRGKLFGELSDNEAPDIVQDVFRRIQQKAHLYKPSAKVLSWMRKIAQHIIIDIVRQQLSRRRRETNYAFARPPQGGEVEGPSPPAWELGDPVNAPGGLCGEDIADHDDFEELHCVVVPCGYAIIPRSSGGDIWVWQGHFPERRARWGKRDRMRDWMRGLGRDDVPGLLGSLGLAPQEEKKNCR